MLKVKEIPSIKLIKEKELNKYISYFKKNFNKISNEIKDYEENIKKVISMIEKFDPNHIYTQFSYSDITSTFLKEYNEKIICKLNINYFVYYYMNNSNFEINEDTLKEYINNCIKITNDEILFFIENSEVTNNKIKINTKNHYDKNDYSYSVIKTIKKILIFKEIKFQEVILDEKKQMILVKLKKNEEFVPFFYYEVLKNGKLILSDLD